MSMGIDFWLNRREVLSPDSEAVVDRGRRVTYRELNRRVNRTSQALMETGLKYGDRIGILSYNSLEFIELIMATARLGLILVPLNWRLAVRELSYILEDSGAKALIFDHELTDLAGKVLDSTRIELSVIIGGEESGTTLSYDQIQEHYSPGPMTATSISNLETPHILMYTAGTTGRPKGAVLTQGASFYNALNLNLILNLTPKDRNLMTVPMFHIAGIGLFTLPVLYTGGSVVIQRLFEPKETLSLLKQEKISLFFGVPAIFLSLIQQPEFNKEYFQTVRTVMSGGSPIPEQLIEYYFNAGIVLQQGFGMSEAAPSISSLDKARSLEKRGSVGLPMFHTATRIVDDNMQDLPPGMVGELLLKGPNLFKEYWNRPEATEAAFTEGWFHTGDLVRCDRDGYLYIIGRKKDMFISGGENIYPAEVENIIFEIPEVAETAVVGIPDETWGESGLAFVVLKPDTTLTEQDILDHLKGRLARFKTPKKVIFTEHIPRNAAGKIMKNILRKRYTKSLEPG